MAYLPYRDLLVVLDTDPSTPERIALASELAARCDAHLIGLYGPLPSAEWDRHVLLDVGLLSIPFFTDPDAIRQQAEATRALFQQGAKKNGISAEWRLSVGNPTVGAALHGRYTDLIVLGQLDAYASGANPLQARPEEVTMLCGRPVLIVPYTGRFPSIGRRVLIGWDASREAARAVHDAMPLLVAAEAVTVLTIDAEQSAYGHGEIPGADIALHLARHGVKAQAERTVSAGIGIGNTLLSRAADFGADLLVIGAYGHSGVREFVLGGVTRTVLTTMTLPVLISH